MSLPSFDHRWVDGDLMGPIIRVLEIRHPDRLDHAPVAWLLVERQETCQRDSDYSIYEASIDISYRIIAGNFSHTPGGSARFDACYSKEYGLVSLTSNSLSHNGTVFLDMPGLEGHRIGTYLMNEIVRWVLCWPEAIVNPVELVSWQADDENKERRNKFYEQFGLIFDYADQGRQAGLSRPMPAKMLTPVETWKQNITEHRMLDYPSAMLYAEERASFELACRTSALDDVICERGRAEAKPVRWVLKRCYRRYVGFFVCAIILAVSLASFYV